jgi:hypothetical protein
MMTDILIFVLFQGLAINGFNQAMDEGMIFNRYKNWLKKRKSWFGKPMGLCIKCSASVGGTITFWPAALYAYGWRPIELFTWVFDIFVLVVINFWIFKKL